MGGGGMGGGGFGGGIQPPSELSPSERLVELIQEQTSPPTKWINIDGEGGTINSYGQYLAIRQTYAGHGAIEKLLNDFRTAIASGGPPVESAAPNANRPRPLPAAPAPPAAQPSGGNGYFQTPPD